jgi:WD40 repeat protein
VAWRSFFLRRRRLLAWSLLTAALFALGVALHAEVLPQPRCVITINRPENLSCLSPDGARLVTYGGGQGGAWLGPVRIWDTASGRERAVFPELRGHLTNAMDPRHYSKSRRFFPEADRHGDLLLLDVTEGRLWNVPLKGLEYGKREIKLVRPGWANVQAHAVSEPTFHFSPREDLLAVYIPRGFPPGVLGPAYVAASSAGLMGSPPGEASVLAASALVAGRDDFICHIVETATGRLVGTVEGVGERERFRQFIEFVEDGTLLLLGIRDAHQNNALAVWDTKLSRMKRIQTNHQPLLLSPDGRKLLAKGREGHVIIDVATGRSQPLPLPRDFTMRLGWAKFSPDSRALVTDGFSSGKPRIEFLEVAGGRKLASEEGLLLADPKFSPDSAFFLISTHPWITVTPARGGNVQMAISSREASIKVGDLRTGRTLWVQRPWEFNPGSWYFSSDSQHLIMKQGKLDVANVHMKQERLEVLDAKTGNVRTTISTDQRDFHLDSKYLATIEATHHLDPVVNFLARWRAGTMHINRPGTTSSSIKVIELPDGREISRLELADVPIPSLSDDGQTLFTQHHEPDRVVIRCWSLPIAAPYRRPLWQVVGTPVAVGLLLLLWRKLPQTRKKTAPAASEG